MASMNYGMQLGRLVLAFSSLGQTFGILATSLVVYLYVFRKFKVRIAYIVMLLALFLSALLNPSSSSWNFFFLYAIILGILIQSSGQVFLTLKTAKLLFFLQSWLFALGIVFFEYEAGLSGGGFTIVNDYTLQLSVLGLYISLVTKDFRYQFICLIFSVLNSAELLTLANAFIIFFHSKAYLRLLCLVLIAISSFILIEHVFDIVSLIIYTVESGVAGTACGSRCFRVFALYHFSSLFFESANILTGLGLGYTQDTLESMKAQNAAVMAGSMHNLMFQLLFELGIFLFAFLIFASRVYSLSYKEIIFLTVVLASTSNSVFSLGLVFLIIGQIVFFKRSQRL